MVGEDRHPWYEKGRGTAHMRQNEFNIGEPTLFACDHEVGGGFERLIRNLLRTLVE